MRRKMRNLSEKAKPLFSRMDFFWEFYSKISHTGDANPYSLHRVHAKKKMPQRTVIPLHYQVLAIKMT